MQLETAQLLLPDKKLSCVSIGNDKLIIEYLSRKRGGSNSKKVVIPRNLELSDELVTAIGLYYAEGNSSSFRRLSNISNIEPTLIKAAMTLFKELGITNEQLKARVKVYNKRLSDKKLIKFWSQKTGIPEQNFIRTSVTESKKTYTRNRPRPPLFGQLEIYFSSVIVKDIIDNLIEKVKVLSITDPGIRRAFLRALAAGEGSVIVLGGKLKEMRIASCDVIEQEFIRNLLRLEGIEPARARYKFYVAISGFNNFKRAAGIRLFDLHPKKSLSFWSGLRKLAVSSGLSERHNRSLNTSLLFAHTARQAI